MKKQQLSSSEKVIFYVGERLKSSEFLANSRDFSLKKLDFLEKQAFFEAVFQTNFNFEAKIALKTGKIQLEICNILRGKNRPKVIMDVEEGIFNVEFGLFQVEFVIFYVDLNTL